MKKLLQLLALSILMSSTAFGYQDAWFSDPITIKYDGTNDAFKGVLPPSAQEDQEIEITWYEILKVESTASKETIAQAANQLLREIDHADTRARNAIKVAVQAGTGKLSYRVFDGLNELPRMSIKDLIKESEYKNVKGLESNYSSWKRYLLAQAALFGITATAYAGAYMDKPDSKWNLKNYSATKKLVEKVASLSGAKKFGMAASGIAAMIGYPILRYRKMFAVGELLADYPVQEVENRIVVFRKRTFAYAYYNGQHMVNVYKYSSPVGYMPLKEWQKKYGLFEQAFKSQLATVLTVGLYCAGLGWAFIP